MKKNMLRLLAILLVCATFKISPIQATPSQTPTNTQISPAQMLLVYYSSINLKDYGQAYSLWLNPPQTFQDFAGGFVDTDHVLPFFGTIQTNPVSSAEYGRIPTVLFGFHTDGTQVSYAGCFSISQTTVGWRIFNADLGFISNRAFPDLSNVSQYLSINCYATSPTATITPTFINFQLSDGQQFLDTYYQIINRRDYATAYGLWLQPLPGPKPNGAPAVDYRTPYADFVAGYADTTYVMVYPGPYNAGGGFAGHGYVAGVIPAVLVGLHLNGSVSAVAGCYVLGGLRANQLGIVSGKFQPLSTTNDIPDGGTILRALTLDCNQFGLSY
ncbi:MAG: hypothetical protein ABI947_14120 [Chloroflexota bacterium]